MKQKKGIRKKILLNTFLIIVILSGALVGVMAYFMAFLTDAILMDTLQPMARTAAQGVQGNLHMLADRLFLIRENTVFSDPESTKEDKLSVLDGAKGGIEFVWLALYAPDGSLYTGSEGSPASITSREMFSYLEETQNLVIDDTALGKQGLEIAIGAPIFSQGEEAKVMYYLVGSYKYDLLNDVMSSINVSSNSTAFIINEDGTIMAHQDVGRVEKAQSVTETLGTGPQVEQLVQNMISGQTDVVQLGSGASQRMVSYAPVRGTHWSLAIMVPRNDFMGPANQAILTAIFITIGLLAIAVIFTIHLANRIQKPLGRVTQRIGMLAEGDLHSQTVTENTKDEIATLSTSLDHTVQSINHYTTEISRVMEELSQSNLNVSVEGEFHGDFISMRDSLNQIIDFLNQIMRSLQNASGQVSSTSHMVLTNATHVQQSSESQSASLSSLHQETQVIGTNILEINQQTIRVNELIAQAVQRLADGEAQMQNMLEAMKEINTNSEEITKINKFLEDIAFQTNILALNAAVEAARAGVAGKGFAVVADEVRSLASKSGESSQRTTVMIENSQKSIEEGTAYATQTAGSLNEVMNIVQDISHITDQLTIAVEAQKTSLDTITTSIDNVNELAKENLNSSLNSAQASKTLTEQADSMQSMAGRFTLRQQDIGRLE